MSPVALWVVATILAVFVFYLDREIRKRELAEEERDLFLAMVGAELQEKAEAE